MAGLLTAGLLARHFERVTLVERDDLEDSAQLRKGVPQGTQTHMDDEAIRTFMRVMHMLKPPTAMFSPRLLLKTLAGQPAESELPRGPEVPTGRAVKAA